MTYFSDETIRQRLERRAREDANLLFCQYEDEKIYYGDLDKNVNRVANGLLNLGIKPGERISLMLSNHPDYIYLILACAKTGIIYIPLNTSLRGPSLDLLLQLADSRVLIVDAVFKDVIRDSFKRTGDTGIEMIITRGGADFKDLGGFRQITFETAFSDASENVPDVPGPEPDDVLTISFTSGTTGVPKGVPLTDRMWHCAGHGVAVLAAVEKGDVMIMWEQLLHIGGAQMLYTSLFYGTSIALLSKFSASRFWDQVRRYKATRMHYLGGVLQILLKQPPKPNDKDNTIKIAWGAACTPEIWDEFSERFDVEIHECYGMSENSSVTTVNLDGVVGSCGKPLPYFDVRLADNGKILGPGKMGEFQVKGKIPGLVIKEYFRNEEATAKSFTEDGWFCTGDLGMRDEAGYYYFKGRTKESVRHKGENISAWEVERVVNDHPDVEESALVGVASELDEDLKIFIKLVPGAKKNPSAIAQWLEPRMPKYQLPRYFAFTDSFDKTQTERIKKASLSRSIDDCWDRLAK